MQEKGYKDMLEQIVNKIKRQKYKAENHKTVRSLAIATQKSGKILITLIVDTMDQSEEDTEDGRSIFAFMHCWNIMCAYYLLRHK